MEKDIILAKVIGRYWLIFDLLIGGIAFTGLFMSDLNAPLKVCFAFVIILIAGLIDLYAMEAANARVSIHEVNIAALQALELRISGNSESTIASSIEQYRRQLVFEDSFANVGLGRVVVHLAKCAAWPLIGWIAASWL